MLQRPRFWDTTVAHKPKTFQNLSTPVSHVPLCYFPSNVIAEMIVVHHRLCIMYTFKGVFRMIRQPVNPKPFQIYAHLIVIFQNIQVGGGGN